MTTTNKKTNNEILLNKYLIKATDTDTQVKFIFRFIVSRYKYTYEHNNTGTIHVCLVKHMLKSMDVNQMITTWKWTWIIIYAQIHKLSHMEECMEFVSVFGFISINKIPFGAIVTFKCVNAKESGDKLKKLYIVCYCTAMH